MFHDHDTDTVVYQFEDLLTPKKKKIFYGIHIGEREAKMVNWRRLLRMSNRSFLAFIFFFSMSTTCLYFIYVAPGIGELTEVYIKRLTRFDLM